MADTKVQRSHDGGIFKRMISRMRSSSDLGRPTNNHSQMSRFRSDMVDRSRRRNTAFKIGVHVHRRTQSQSSAATCPPGRSASDTALSRVLWDEAYDNLRLDPSTSSLVVAYEAIISQELPDDLKFSAHSRVSLPREGDLETCDRRRELMIAILRAGLNKRRGSKASQVDDMARQLLTCVKGKVESAWGEFSSAATAWSGLCTLTPVSLHGHFNMIGQALTRYSKAPH